MGANDPALTMEVMKATYLAWYPNAELESMPNAGHHPMGETPVALATSIEKFLRRSLQRSGYCALTDGARICISRAAVSPSTILASVTAR